MVPPRIVFYGHFGLKEDILTTYLINSGLPVQVVSDHSSILQAVALDEPTIILLALDPKSPEFTGLVQEIRAQTRHRKTYILIFNGDGEIVAALPNTEVMPRPNQLSETVQRILEIARTSGFQNQT